MERVCKHCGLYFGSIKSKQNHSPNCRSKKSNKSSDKQSTQSMRKVRPQRIEARDQKELLCAMAFQELEWHDINDVDFDGVENDILEITRLFGRMHKTRKMNIAFFLFSLKVVH